MTKAIIIKTEALPLVVEVDNFSKENCLKAIAKGIKTDVNNLEQLSVSVGYGIYGVKEITPSVKNIATNPVNDVGYAHTLEVEYAEFVK